MKVSQLVVCLCIVISVIGVAQAAAGGSTKRPARYTVKWYPTGLGYEYAAYVYDYYRIAGGFIKSAKTPYPQGCFNLCLNSPPCKSFSWGKKAKKCSLFSSYSYPPDNKGDKRVTWYPDEGYISGFYYDGEEMILPPR